MRAIAAILVVLLVSAKASATVVITDDPVFESQYAAPPVYSPLVWRGAGKDVHGIWSTDEAIQRLQLRLEYLENKATSDCIKTTDADTKAVVSSRSSLWIVGAAALVVGIVGGVVIEKHTRR